MVSCKVVKIPFFKMSGSGNDFILIDNRQGVLNADHLGDFVPKVCARKVSVGADGLILIEPSQRVDFRWRFFNADGSEAEMCGNGGRCAARFAVLKGITTPKLAFETLAGIIEAEVNGRQVKLQMVQPTGLKLNLDVPIDGQNHQLHFINTGVPHAIKMVEDAAAVAVKDLGRKIRFHAQFQPAGTNANFVQPVDRKHLKVRTYERGVEDETLACGTGSVAAALIFALKGNIRDSVNVYTRSSEVLKVYFERSGRNFKNVWLEGKARIVYQGAYYV